MEGFASVTQCPAEGEATKEVKKVGIAMRLRQMRNDADNIRAYIRK